MRLNEIKNFKGEEVIFQKDGKIISELDGSNLKNVSVEMTNVTGLPFVKLTIDQFEALENKDNNKIYIIVEEDLGGQTNYKYYDKLYVSNVTGTGLDGSDLSNLNGTWNRITTTDVNEDDGYTSEIWQKDGGTETLKCVGTWVVNNGNGETILDSGMTAKTPWEIVDWMGEGYSISNNFCVKVDKKLPSYVVINTIGTELAQGKYVYNMALSDSSWDVWLNENNEFVMVKATYWNEANICEIQFFIGPKDFLNELDSEHNAYFGQAEPQTTYEAVEAIMPSDAIFSKGILGKSPVPEFAKA